MRIPTALLVVALSALAGHTAQAQTRPNFSGTWVQVTPSAPEDGGGSEEIVKQDAETLTADHASEGDGHHLVYKLNGESHNKLGQIAIDSKAVWDGAKLVITSTATYPDGRKREDRVTWSLGADGRLTIESSIKNPNGTTSDVKTVYRKKK